MSMPAGIMMPGVYMPVAIALPLQTWLRLVWLSCLDATLATSMITEDNWTGDNRARAFSPTHEPMLRMCFLAMEVFMVLQFCDEETRKQSGLDGATRLHEEAGRKDLAQSIVHGVFRGNKGGKLDTSLWRRRWQWDPPAGVVYGKATLLSRWHRHYWLQRHSWSIWFNKMTDVRPSLVSMQT